jgi:hypothetical protein
MDFTAVNEKYIMPVSKKALCLWLEFFSPKCPNKRDLIIMN